jgi:hypothetical protein
MDLTNLWPGAAEAKCHSLTKVPMQLHYFADRVQASRLTAPDLVPREGSEQGTES